MTQQDHTLLDIFKERLSSPFMFTYFWVFCFWNWHAIAWLVMEPLTISLKLQQFSSKYEWGWEWPLAVSLGMVIVLPWANAFVEVLKRFAENKTNIWLTKRGWKEMVEQEKHQRVETQLRRANANIETLDGTIDNLKINQAESEKEVELLRNKLQAAEKEKAKLALEIDEARRNKEKISKEIERADKSHTIQVESLNNHKLELERRLNEMIEAVQNVKADEIEHLKSFTNEYKQSPSSVSAKDFIDVVGILKKYESIANDIRKAEGLNSEEELVTSPAGTMNNRMKNGSYMVDNSSSMRVEKK